MRIIRLVHDALEIDQPSPHSVQETVRDFKRDEARRLRPFGWCWSKEIYPVTPRHKPI